MDETLLRGEVIKQFPGQKDSNPTSYKSVATMTNDEIAAAHQGQPDPLRGMVVPQENLLAHQRSIVEDTLDALAQGRKPLLDRKPTKAPVVSISGTSDPQLAKSGIAIGDKVYHAKRKEEGQVIDVSLKSGVRVRLDDKSTVWWNPKFLAKIPKM